MPKQSTQPLWRRFLRRHCYGLYRYADNLLRIPSKALAWRAYNRLLRPGTVALKRKLRRISQPTAMLWSKALGGMPPLEAAQEWLAGRVTTPSCTQGPDLDRLCRLALASDPHGVAETLSMAEDCLRGDFRLLEAKPAVKLSLPFDWSANPIGDIEWPHALNRFRSYARCLSRAYRYTGREQYAQLLVRIMEDWIEQNPQGAPISWLSMETCLRLIEWSWALSFLRGSAALTSRCLLRIWGSMMLQARWLSRHVEFELSDNHLIYNLAGLYMLSRAFPFLVDPQEAHRARTEFLVQLRRQHRRDGMNVEQSTHYFVQVARICVETFLLDGPGAPGHEELESHIRRFMDNIAGFIRPDGAMPLLGDAFTSFFERSATVDARVLLAWAAIAFGRSDYRHIVKTLPESASFLLGAKAEAFEALPPAQPASTTCVMPDSGYFTARSDWTAEASYLCAHAGPMGFPPVPAHGHPDLLSFEWHHRGRPLVVDPGTYEYEPGEWAYYFRRTRAHATVTIDHQDQSTQWGFTRWVDLPNCRVLAHGAAGRAFWLEAEHDGYARLAEGVIHRRRLACLMPDFLIVEDVLEGSGEHLVQQTFSLAPSVACSPAVGQDGAIVSTGVSSIIIKPLLFPGRWACRCVKGQKEPCIWGFTASNYGVCDPSWVVCFETFAAMPARCLTVLAAVQSVRQTGKLEWELHAAERQVIRLRAGTAGGFGATLSQDGAPLCALWAGLEGPPDADQARTAGVWTDGQWRYSDFE